jgi:hypothetical protein
MLLTNTLAHNIRNTHYTAYLNSGLLQLKLGIYSSTMWRKMYYTNKGVLMGGSFPSENTTSMIKTVPPSNHFTNCGHCSGC